jgi:hypothetical protein
MDALGATMLAARIRAGVRIGQSIELLSDSAEHPNLRRGDRGLVSGFSRDGKVVVTWGDGFVAILDPSLENYERSAGPAPEPAPIVSAA